MFRFRNETKYSENIEKSSYLRYHRLVNGMNKRKDISFISNDNLDLFNLLNIIRYKTFISLITVIHLRGGVR